MEFSLTFRRVLYAMFGMAILFDLFKPANPAGAATVFCGLLVWVVSKVQ